MTGQMDWRSCVTWATLVLAVTLGSGLMWQVLAAGPNEVNFDLSAISRVGVLIWAGLYGLMCLSILLGARHALAGLAANPLGVALVAMALLSGAWSDMPGYATYTALQLSILSIFGISAGQQLSMRQVWGAIAIAFSIVVVTSVVFIMLLPSYGIVQSTQNQGAWRGAFLEKNIFGALMVYAVATAAVGAVIMRGRRRSCAIIALAACYALMIPIRAVSAFFVAILVLCALTTLLAARQPRPHAQAALGLGLIVVSATLAGGALFASDILEGLGKDTSLTGRDELWVYARDAIAAHPFLGFGFGSFWDNAGPLGGVDLTRGIDWGPRSAHNVWLETGLQLGLLGIGLLAAFLLQIAKRLWVAVSRGNDPVVFWPCLIVFAHMWIGATESNLFIHQSVYHLLLYLVAGMVSRELGAGAPAGRGERAELARRADFAGMWGIGRRAPPRPQDVGPAGRGGHFEDGT
ncbi:O-antigen ligase family protein [Salinarimonas soli]|uniref:O-antigen ligase family protein n=1 Tax=Salinarimonas soli TaxID=1638099 RepID=A0A5B2V974_9HYPH|nr:O-antigen ligase family protein [Salinarimonas soli]KAA2234787.1 O-antigen ligase family protein [Salinarimonas soli]